MNITQHFIKPLDVLFLRGNKLFGDPGSYGESLVPPWPSVLAGALRSGLIAKRGYDPVEFAKGLFQEDHELGTPENPGSFLLASVQLASRSVIKGKYRYEKLFPMPHDLLVFEKSSNELEVRRIKPKRLSDKILSSRSTALAPVMSEKTRSKPSSSTYFLNTAGWKAHLAGEEVNAAHLIKSDKLWEVENRIGIGIKESTRSVDRDTGKLFTSQAVNFKNRKHCDESSYDVGFLVEVAGAILPEKFAISLGGDGRGALVTHVNPEEITSLKEYTTDLLNQIIEDKKCRIILTSPGLFKNGWTPTSVEMQKQEFDFQFINIEAELDCAIVPRANYVSGFDIPNRRPKVAQRTAPVGSVYWLNSFDSTPESLHELLNRGLWSTLEENSSRRVEGFNRFTFAIY